MSVTQRSAGPYVATLAALAFVGAAASLYLLARSWRGGPEAFAYLAGLCALTVLAHRHGLIVPWRGESTIISLDEPIVLLTLLLLPAPAVVLVVGVSILIVQVLARREPLKRVFNVASYSLAGGAAALTFGGATMLGAPDLVAASVAILAYTLTSQLLVSGVFAVLERASVLQVYWERYAMLGALHASVGLSVGIATVALWSLSPVALLALVPLATSAILFVRIHGRSERENQAREKLARMVDRLAQETELDRVVSTVLDTCGEVFQPGSAQLELRPRPELPEATTWTWNRAFAGGAAGPRNPPIEATLFSRSGEILGWISIFPSNKSKERYSRIERGILRIVAAQASAAVENAVSLRDLLQVRSFRDILIQTIPAGIAHVDRDGRLRDANAFLRRALQLPDGARSLAEAPAILADATLLVKLEAFLHGHEFRDHDLEATDERGARLWLSVTGVRVDTAAGGGGVLMFNDVTQRHLAEELRRGATITRPLVRRIVLDLVERLAAPHAAISAVGRSLAAEVQGDAIEDFVRAFRAMGLGDLSFEKRDGQAYVFTARDLVEQRKRSRQPSCHLTLGFAEGAIAKLHPGEGSLGTEVRCRSQGHEACQFLVVPRERLAPTQPARRNAATEAAGRARASPPADGPVHIAAPPAWAVPETAPPAPDADAAATPARPRER